MMKCRDQGAGLASLTGIHKYTMGVTGATGTHSY